MIKVSLIAPRGSLLINGHLVPENRLLILSPVD